MKVCGPTSRWLIRQRFASWTNLIGSLDGKDVTIVILVHVSTIAASVSTLP